MFGRPTYLSTAGSHHPVLPQSLAAPSVSCLRVELTEEGCFLDHFDVPSPLPPHPVVEIQRPFSPVALETLSGITTS